MGLDSTYTQTHIEGPCRGGADTSQKHVRGEGGSGKNQGEKEWWEGDRRKREMGRSRMGGKGWRMIRGRGTGRAWAERRWEGEESGREDGR